jgi:hypothetical protein
MLAEPAADGVSKIKIKIKVEVESRAGARRSRRDFRAGATRLQWIGGTPLPPRRRGDLPLARGGVLADWGWRLAGRNGNYGDDPPLP